MMGLVAPVHADALPWVLVVFRFKPEVAGRTLNTQFGFRKPRDGRGKSNI
jgi:hypothetical protein